MTEPLWEVPDGWVWSSFGSALEIAQDLISPERVRDLPHVAPNHIESITGRLNGVVSVAEDGVISAKQRFHPRTGAVLEDPALPPKGDGRRLRRVCSADMYPLWPTDAIDVGYLFQWLVSEDFRDEALSHQSLTQKSL